MYHTLLYWFRIGAWFWIFSYYNSSPFIVRYGNVIVFTSDTSMMTFTFRSKIIFVSFTTSIFKLETSSKAWVEVPSWTNGRATSGILIGTKYRLRITYSELIDQSCQLYLFSLRSKAKNRQY